MGVTFQISNTDFRFRFPFISFRLIVVFSVVACIQKKEKHFPQTEHYCNIGLRYKIIRRVGGKYLKYRNSLISRLHSKRLVAKVSSIKVTSVERGGYCSLGEESLQQPAGPSLDALVPCAGERISGNVGGPASEQLVRANDLFN